MIFHMKLLSSTTLPALLLALAASAAPAQDRVTYRDRSARGGVQTATGRIESESVAGVRLGGRTISSADLVDVHYDVSGAVRLDYNSAVAAEAGRPADALKAYDALLKTPGVQANRALKRHLEYKVAALTAALADGAEQVPPAVAALEKFRKDHPDAWQLMPATRTLARLLLDKAPPDEAAARKAWDDLAATPGVPAEVKRECAFQVIDLLLTAGHTAEAKQKLSALPADEPRVRVYQIACQATPDNVEATARQLEALIDQTADAALKATAYNVLGDCYRRDPKHKKDALYAYLWVDVVYNQDPSEAVKAAGRLADLFGELKDDERARKYRDKARGK